MFQKTVGWTVLVCMVGLSLSPAYAQSASVVDNSQSLYLESVFRRLDALRSIVDRTQFDPNALLDSLDFDADRLIKYVKEEIHFQAYEGVLRGPEGALISRSGNSLDQSLLLAMLLKDAGYDARVVRGRLPADQARELLRGMVKEVTWHSAFKDSGKLDRLMHWLSPTFHDEPDQFQREMNQITERAIKVSTKHEENIRSINLALQNVLSATDARSDAKRFESELLASAQDYFWVAYKNVASGKWKSAHPAFAKSEPVEPQTSEYFEDSIPSELQHRVRFQVFLETYSGNSRNVVPLMSQWERPSSNVQNMPQTLTLIPYTDFEFSGKLDLNTGLARANLFTVMLNGSLAPDAKVFTLDGLVGPPDALSGAGEFFATVSGKGLNAANALAGIGSSEKSSNFRLSRIWFEYSIIAPGGKTKTVSRDILNTNTDGQRFVLGRSVSDESWKAQLKLALVQSRQINVVTGPVSPAFSISQYIAYAQSAQDSLRKMQQLATDGALVASTEVLASFDPLPDLRAAKYFAVAQGDLGFRADSVSYLAEPMIVTFGRGLSDSSTGDVHGYGQTDIVFNTRRSMKLSGQDILNDTERSSLMGIRDTFLENTLSDNKGPQSRTSAFELLASHTSELQLVIPQRSSDIDNFDFDASTLLHAKSELNSGYGLIIPKNSSEVSSAWWRVDLDSGTVTGMSFGPGGYGGLEAVDYLTILSVGVAVVIRWVGYYDCWENESGVALFCCLVDSFITNVFVGLVAFALANLAGAGIMAVGGTMMGGSAVAVSSKELGLVIAIINTSMLDVPGAFVSFTDFKIKVCGTISGSGS